MSGQWWESNLIVGPFSNITEANAWAAANPSSLLLGLLATIDGVPCSWDGTLWDSLDLSKVRSPTVYDIQNNLYARETLPQVYIEALIPPSAGSSIAALAKVSLDRSSRVPVKRGSENAQNIQSEAISIPITVDGHKAGSATVTLTTTKLSAVPSTVLKPMFLGDSISATEFTGFDGSLVGGWGIASLVQEFWKRDSVDGLAGVCVPMGHIGNVTGRSTSYRGTSYPLRAFHEARPGWCAATWLRHPVLLTASDSASSSTSANALASWGLCGLTAVYGHNYNGSVLDKNRIRSAVPTFAPGSYEYTADVWDYLRQRSGWAGPQTAWVDNGTNRGHIDTAVAAIVVAPDNAFWSPGAKFSPYFWSGRYKTLSADGTTRLVSGSTAGTLITSGNLANIDVNDRPTHFLIELGENDRWFFPKDLAQTVADLTEIRGNINTAFAWMGASAPKVAFFFTRIPGCYDRFGNRDVPAQILNQYNAPWKYDLIAACKAAGLTVIDADACQDSASSANWSQQKYSTLDSGAIVEFGGHDGVHPGLNALRGVAFQIYAWMISTVATP